MTGARRVAQLRQANGLTLNLRHDAQATEAAALLQVAAGSDAEPQARPGLAHLLEHLLFAGGAAYQQQQRLMSWIPAQGGRLNATTLSDRTAFFFTVEPEKLEPGLARLVDMLAAPLFDCAALEQEINVIDAECRLLATDPDSLCDAAQLSLFDGAPALRRFQVGNRAGFGADLPSLRQALREFHQQHYHAGAMTLWLQGPQSLDDLRALAGRYAACLPDARTIAPAAPLRLEARGDAMLRLDGPPRLRLSFALNGWRENDAGWLAILRVLLADEADGSLMAWMRERDWCDGIRLVNNWRGPDAAIVAVEFTLARADPVFGVQAERALAYWLERLSALSVRQLHHYAWLARRRFHNQSPLDQLRELAFDGPAPQATDPQVWQRWLTRFRPEGISRLWITPQVRGNTLRSRGFDLQLAPFTPPAVAPGPAPAFCFHDGDLWSRMQPLSLMQPLSRKPHLLQQRHLFRQQSIPRTLSLPLMPPVSPAIVPAESVTLRHLKAGEAAVLMLYPAPESAFTELQGHILQAALRATAANLAHCASELRIDRRQGVWLLQLGADEALMPAALEAISERLRAVPDAVVRRAVRARRQERRQEQGQIPVRRLLNRLPRWLRAPAGEGGGSARRPADILWQGTLYGGGASLHQTLSGMLSRLPGAFARPAMPAATHSPAAITALSRDGDSPTSMPTLLGHGCSSAAASSSAISKIPGAARYMLAQKAGDNAMVLFCPPPSADIDTQLAWRLLALIYQPLFFQQLRVEQNIGYVASCSFHSAAWRAGILFALQSPHLDSENLHRHTLAFLQGMERWFDEMPAELLEEKRSTLWRMLTRQDPNRFIRAGQACFAVNPALTTPQAQARLKQINTKALRHWHRLFTDSARHFAGNILAVTATAR